MLVEKLAQLDIPDQIHNWLTNFFPGHSHRTEYLDQQSTVQMINIRGDISRSERGDARQRNVQIRGRYVPNRAGK